MNIKTKALLLLVPLCVFASLASAWSSYSGSAATVEWAKRRELQETALLVQNSINDIAAGALARATLVADLPEVKAALRAGDRDALGKLLLPAFEDQREQFNVKEGQFHLPPATSFLRLHAPAEGHGEDLSSYREMVLSANRKLTPHKGVEASRSGISIRGLALVTDAQGPIGTFEIGIRFAGVLDRIKRNTGYDAVAFVNDDLVRRVSTNLPRPDPERIVAGYQALDPTNWPATRAVVSPDLLRATTDIVYRTPVIDGIDQGVVAVPLMDFKGDPIGAVVATKAYPELGAQRRSALVRAIGFALLQAVLLTGAILLIVSAMLIRPISAISEKIARIAKGDDPSLGMPDLPKANDEIGTVVRSVENLERSLSELRRAARERRPDA